VRRHISELVRKLGVENRAELTTFAASVADHAANGRVQGT
jgi:DNA-binding NarL/FixJ family response regulator